VRFNFSGLLFRTIPVKKGATAADLATLHLHVDRRDVLGTTHHEAGTLRMNTNAADGVTNEFGCIHDTTNCYVAGPAVHPRRSVTVRRASATPVSIGLGAPARARRTP
jgi:hypothetical protein